MFNSLINTTNMITLTDHTGFGLPNANNFSGCTYAQTNDGDILQVPQDQIDAIACILLKDVFDNLFDAEEPNGIKTIGDDEFYDYMPDRIENLLLLAPDWENLLKKVIRYWDQKAGLEDDLLYTECFGYDD